MPLDRPSPYHSAKSRRSERVRRAASPARARRRPRKRSIAALELHESKFALAATIACRGRALRRPGRAGGARRERAARAARRSSARSSGRRRCAAPVAAGGVPARRVVRRRRSTSTRGSSAPGSSTPPTTTLDYVPAWLPARLLERAEARRRPDQLRRRRLAGGARGPRRPRGSGATCLPWLKESMGVINERSTNWCVVPCPTHDWAAVVYPELEAEEAYERLWNELWHVCGSTNPTRRRPGTSGSPSSAPARPPSTGAGSTRSSCAGRGPSSRSACSRRRRWMAGDFTTRDGLRHLPNLPSEEVFTAPDPERVDGHVTSTKPLVLKDGTIVRGLRVRFEGGRAVEVDADENGEAMRAKVATDDGAARLGEVALVDRRRAGSADSARSSSTRCSTRTLRATSRSAVPTGSRSTTRRTAPGSTRARSTSTS